MTESSPLVVEADGPVRIVTMNRPDDMNAADAEMHRGLADVWGTIATDPSARAVVLTGAGRAFSAGGDFPRMQATQYDRDIQDEVFDEARRTVHGLLNLPQPVIAAVNGPAVGLGASLVSLCDIAIASSKSFLSDPHLGVGLVPADGAALIWPTIIGLHRAKEFVYLGTRISAERALELGLVNQVVAPEDTLSTAVALAHRLAAVPRRAMQDTKRLMNTNLRRDIVGLLDQAIAAERQSVSSPEHIEIVENLIARAATKS